MNPFKLNANFNTNVQELYIPQKVKRTTVLMAQELHDPSRDDKNHCSNGTVTPLLEQRWSLSCTSFIFPSVANQVLGTDKTLPLSG